MTEKNNSLYLQLENVSNTSSFNITKLKPFPFPENKIPKPLSSEHLFVERLDRYDFFVLRSLRNQYFYIEAKEEKIIVDIEGNEEILCLMVSFGNEKRSLGYRTMDDSQLFVNVYNDSRKLQELPKNLEKFYGSILMKTSSYLNNYENSIKIPNENANDLQKLNQNTMRDMYRVDGGELEFLNYLSKANKEK